MSRMTGRIRLGRKALIGFVAALVAVGALSAWFLLRGRPATMPTATCGEVVAELGGFGAGFRETDAGALACFRQAVTSCRDASLLVAESGVDSGTRDVIALHRDSAACTARVTEQQYVMHDNSPVLQFVCHQVHADDSGETVACDNGDKFSIPLHAG